MILQQFKNYKTIVFLPLMIIAIFFLCSCMAKNPMPPAATQNPPLVAT